MTPNKIAVMIAEPLGKQFDVPFLEMIKDRVIYWRATHVRRTLEKDPNRRKFFLQSVTLQMRKRSAVDCGIDLDCYIAETVEEMPEPIGANRVLFDYVGSVDGGNAFTWGQRAWNKFKAYDKYASKVANISYTGLNRHIQVYGNPDIPYILIEGVFSDPQQVLKLQCCNNDVKDCDFGDAELQIPGDILQLIIQSIMQIDFNINPQQQPITDVPVNVTDHDLNRA